MFTLTGNEKAFLGGFVAALTAALVQVVQSGVITWREAGWSLLVWVLTHATVWLATNTVPTDVPSTPATTNTAVPPQDTPAQ